MRQMTSLTMLQKYLPQNVSVVSPNKRTFSALTPWTLFFSSAMIPSFSLTRVHAFSIVFSFFFASSALSATAFSNLLMVDVVSDWCSLITISIWLIWDALCFIPHFCSFKIRSRFSFFSILFRIAFSSSVGGYENQYLVLIGTWKVYNTIDMSMTTAPSHDKSENMDPDRIPFFLQ